MAANNFQIPGIILHSTPIPELRAMIGEVIEEKLSNFRQPSETPPGTHKDYISRKEVCDLLQISTATLFYWTKDGTLKGYRIGSRVLYKTAEVEAALTEIACTKNKRRRA